MVCGGCVKRRVNTNAMASKEGLEAAIGGKYGSLNNRQIIARLEKYKRLYCSDKECRYKCDYTMFTVCKKS